MTEIKMVLQVNKKNEVFLLNQKKYIDQYLRQLKKDNINPDGQQLIVSNISINSKTGETNRKVEFDNSTAEHLDLSEVNTTTAWEMDSMFESAKAKTIDISGFDTSKVKTMIQMFNNAEVDTVIFGDKFSSSSLLDIEGMFDGKKIITLKFPEGTTIPKWMKNYYEMNYVYY